ncbi:dehydrogenase/reductase SDR family member 7-like [Tropilaelaps mercedesae]|uniref:Dehydrogenase/reductase SDR family member 7-like n=1 Tax=Tropilaelaps mercedesae TaxID=418985 RepID=A0A1V9WYZ7_9ACAR|nr:dehydrogenase/reductase SDR family member 7-like [Tropilaelaps mercedesae]
MYLYLFLVVAILIALFVWYKLADADLTLLWCSKFRRANFKKYAGRVVWITGASSGIGEEVAYAFSRLGARLAISGTRRDALERVRAECLKRKALDVLCIPFDVTDCESHEKMLATVLQSYKRLDVLVNNAGRLQRAQFISSTVDVEKQLFDVNVFGSINICRVVVKHWLLMNQSFAQLFLTSSASGKMGSPFSAAYAGSKHAVHGYLESLRNELCIIGSKIQITIGCPGPVRSNIRANALTNKKGERYKKEDAVSERKLMDTSRCAELIVSGVANSLDELWIAEQPLLALYYVYQYFPSTFRRYLIKFIMTKEQIEKFRKEG